MINIAKLLKNAPKGMKLYSPLLGEVEFAEVMDTDYVPIRVMCGIIGERFDEFGRYKGNEYPNAECLLFPSKDCRTWEGWKSPVEPNFKVGSWLYHNTLGVRPILIKGYSKTQGYEVECIRSTYYLQKGVVENEYHLWSMADAKDGDILHHSCTASNGTFIFKGVNESGKIFCYCDYDSEDHFCLGEYHHIPHGPDSKFVHPATKEQRNLLFAKMREAGYEWDEKKKELKKIQPHYDIANFKPFDKVLVRLGNKSEWTCDFFSYYHTGFHCIGCDDWSQCIPFEGNEHLLGTTDMCDEQYINW